MNRIKFFIIALFAFSHLTCFKSWAQSDTQQVSDFDASFGILDKTKNLRTCPGNYAYLFDTSKKTTASIEKIFGNSEEGFSNIYAHWKLLNSKDYKFTKRDAGRGYILNLKRKIRPAYKSKCGDNGIVTFENVVEGEYFLVIPVFWLPNPSKPIFQDHHYDLKNNKVIVRIPSTFKGGVYMSHVNTAEQSNFLKKVTLP